MALGPKLKWIKSEIQNKVTSILFLIISLLLSLLIIRNLDLNFLVYSILISSAFFLFFISSKDLLTKKFQNLSQNIAHLGFSLLILSILFNNIFSSEVITNLKVGETFSSEKIKITFSSIEKTERQNFKVIKGNFSIENKNRPLEIFSPELRIYNQPNIVTSEAYIKTNVFEDKFITMNLVQNQDYFNIRYQIKPFMIWIWLSVLLIGFGGLISLFKNRYEK